MKNRLLLPLAGVVGVFLSSGIALWLAHTPQVRRPIAKLAPIQRGNPSDAKQRHLEQEILEIRQELRRMARQARERGAPPAAVVEATELEQLPEKDTDDWEGNQEARVFSMRNNLAERVALEPQDDKWSRGYEKELGSQFAELDQHSVLDIECRHSLCQVRLESHGKDDPAGNLAEYIGKTFANETYGYLNDKGEVVVYIARDNYTLGT